MLIYNMQHIFVLLRKLKEIYYGQFIYMYIYIYIYIFKSFHVNENDEYFKGKKRINKTKYQIVHPTFDNSLI
ncbi:hypothetical protein PFBG_05133 [Plasmodium falciparum 7G8]|uniref:Uncharacterized protein n=1 Tax=Plasmodium falciparum (isolate 7G8) TaxID=57266 RepID=W7EV55_PLAF8|nr:hypothetical protein PFBG_05133 [Plasmodium falciparum 7G8]